MTEVPTAGVSLLLRERFNSVPVVIVLVGSLVLPLAFWTGFEDTFAFAKATGLRVIALAGLSWLAVRFAVTGMRGLIRFHWIDWAVFAYLALNVAAFAWSVNPSQSLFGERLQWQGLLTILLYVLFFYLTRAVFTTEGRVAALFSTIAVAGLIAAGYAVVQRAGLDPIWDFLPRGRVFSTLGQPNWLAAYLVMAVPVTVSLALYGSKPWRRAVPMAAVMMLVGVALTLSRGGYAGLVVAGLVFALPQAGGLKLQQRGRTVVWIAALAILVGLGALLAPVRSAATEAWHRAWSSTDLSGFEVRQQLALWEVGVAMALDHPVLGTGQETYPELFDSYRDDVLDPYRADAVRDFRPESAHSVYIATAAGSGIPSLAAYIGVVAAFFVVVTRSLRTARRWRRVALLGAMGAIAGHIVTDAFMTAEVAGSFTFWVVMGAALALSQTTGASATEQSTTGSRRATARIKPLSNGARI